MYPTRIRIHSSTQDSSRNIGNRACVEVAILIAVPSPDKKHILIYRPQDSGFIPYSKISILHSGLKKIRIRMPGSPDALCGRKPNSERKSCGLKNMLRRRVDGALINGWSVNFCHVSVKKIAVN